VLIRAFGSRINASIDAMVLNDIPRIRHPST
jgi:hypothetical protein